MTATQLDDAFAVYGMAAIILVVLSQTIFGKEGFNVYLTNSALARFFPDTSTGYMANFGQILGDNSDSYFVLD